MFEKRSALQENNRHCLEQSNKELFVMRLLEASAAVTVSKRKRISQGSFSITLEIERSEFWKVFHNLAVEKLL